MCFRIGHGRKSGRTGNADELFCSRGNQLFLEQTCTASLDAVQLVIDFVCTVKSDVQNNVFGQTVESHWHEAGLFDDFSALETWRRRRE